MTKHHSWRDATQVSELSLTRGKQVYLSHTVFRKSILEFSLASTERVTKISGNLCALSLQE